MRLRTKIVLYAGALAAAVVVSVAVALSSVERAGYNNARTVLAYREFISYLRIAEAVAHVFDRARSDLLQYDELSFDVDAAEERLQALVAHTREITEIEAGQEMRPDEAMFERERLDSIERELTLTFQELRAARDLCAEGRRTDCVAALERLFQENIDQRFSTLLQSGLADESQEVEASLADQERVRAMSLWTSAAALGCLLVVGVGGLLLARQLTGRLAQIEAGAEAFGAGRLGYRIEATGRDELAALAGRFNLMAAQLGEQRRAREEIREGLECAVAERTAELSEAYEALRQRDEIRRSFLADIGHELRTPITALRGEAEVALRCRKDKETAYAAALSRIVEHAAQLTRFVEDIFMIARAESGVLDMRRGPIDLASAAESAIEQLGGVLALHEAEAVFTAEERPAWIAGDAQRVRQLTQLLIDNALTHGPRGVRVAVAVRRVGDVWRLMVADDGPGIDSADLELMFERFHRSEASARKPGAGLGLPIARSIVLAHGGRIWMESGDEGGLTVWAEFPVFLPRKAAA